MSDFTPIVGIGASAGGLEALTEFVQAIPNDSGAIYVVVQHLAPDQPSLMDRLLGAHAPIPVTRVEDREIAAPDHIYIIPPGQFLEIEDGRFRLVAYDRERGVRTPIDRFFSSLAEAAGRAAFAVVLSGTGSDGTMGVRAVKSHGGVAMVQESRSARFPGMPESAAATGLVDFVLPADQLPGRIFDIVRHRRKLEDEVGQDSLLVEIEARLPEFLERLEADGAAFSGYKPGTLVRRVARRMTLRRQSTLDGYLATLDAEGEERRCLTQDFLIGVTEFFRDPAAFETLRRRALEPLLDRDRTSLRIWVPGCSTGEEANSIAILLAELMEARGDPRDWKIFGTDIDVDALRQAREGAYPEASLTSLRDDRRSRYFVREDADWRVSTALRERCVFAPHNLLQDPPFSRLDLISCRNVMIYLTADSQEALLQRFHYALNASGFLFLGPSETLGRSDRHFQTVDRSARLFRRDDAASAGFSAVAGPRPRASDLQAVGGQRTPSGETARARTDDIEAASEQAYLRLRAAPFATVDRRNEVRYVSEAMTAFVKPSSGATGTGLDAYLTPELRLPAHSAIAECRETGEPADIRDVVATIDGKHRLFDLSATPLPQAADLILLALTEVRTRDAAELEDAAPRADDARRDQELILTRKRLAALQRDFETVEQELRSANEELLSMNEELQSTNEELETSREELQSINEELETINAELTENNRQLVRANSDLKNLLESTRIATLIIDEVDCVRLFTPAVTRLFGVQDRDIGRPITDLASKVEYPELREDAMEVRRTLNPRDREVRIPDTDETFHATVRPYRTLDNRLDGVVITFVDVTNRKRNQSQLAENARVLAERYAELETLYHTAPIGLCLQDRELRYLRINETLAAINGVPAADHIGRPQMEIVPATSDEITGIQRRVFETGEPALGLEITTETPAAPGHPREFVVDYYPVRNGEEIFAIGACVREVTDKRALEREVAESEARLRRIFDDAPVCIAMHDGPEHHYTYSNPMYDRAVGGRALIGKPLREAMPDLDGWGVFEKFDTVFQTGRAIETAELEVELDGEGGRGRRIFNLLLQPWFDNDGSVEGVMSFAFDVTEQVEARRRVAASETRQRIAVDAAELGVFVWRMDEDVAHWENDRIYEIFGRDPARGPLSFVEFSETTLQSDVEIFAREIEEARQVGRLNTRVRIRRESDRALRWIEYFGLFDSEGRRAPTLTGVVADVTDRVAADERRRVLVAELEHRVKNTLATVQAIARMSARMARSTDDMVESLVSRLNAISRTHDALTAEDWDGSSLRALAEAEIAPYLDDVARRFRYRGEDLRLEPRVAMSLGLALHELATNAAKHGALSNGEGRVDLTVEGGPDGLARLEWRESGGPRVSAPSREGFGSFLVTRLLQSDLDADIEMTYAPEGVICDIRRRNGASDARS